MAALLVSFVQRETFPVKWIQTGVCRAQPESIQTTRKPASQDCALPGLGGGEGWPLPVRPAVYLSVITAEVLWCFVKPGDTPVVKAPPCWSPSPRVPPTFHPVLSHFFTGPWALRALCAFALTSSPCGSLRFPKALLALPESTGAPTPGIMATGTTSVND